MKFIINANYGSFDNIQKAANSEKLINWWDDRDERQIHCTECFAALEIIEHLKLANLKYIGDKSELEKLNIGDMSENLRILVGKAEISKRLDEVPLAGRDGAYKSF